MGRIIGVFSSDTTDFRPDVNDENANLPVNNMACIPEMAAPIDSVTSFAY